MATTDTKRTLPQCTLPGDPAPWFTIRATINPKFHFDSAAGRRVVLFFFGSLASPAVQAAAASFLGELRRIRRLGGYPFGVCIDPADETGGRLGSLADQLTVFFDFDRRVSHAFGVIGRAPGEPGGQTAFSACSIVLDEGLRLLTRIPVEEGKPHGEAVRDFLATLPPAMKRQPVTGTAPVLLIPDVLDRATCRELIALWEAGGNEDSGYMRTGPDGKLVGYIDYGRKRRRDHFIANEHPLYKRLSAITTRRVKPAVLRAFHYDITRVERFCIACYDADEGGYFKEHRDFDDPASSHRAFAMTLNLNAEDYDGGDLVFAEFGQHLYKPHTGEAIVFSGYLLHEAMPVTRGRRFALLSFFYGEKEAQVRDAYRQKHGSEMETIRVTGEEPAEQE